MKVASETRSMKGCNGISFNFYGFRVTVKSDNEYILEDIRRDFSYFICQFGNGNALLEIITDNFPGAKLPKLIAVFQTPRNVVYRNGVISYLDYYGRGLLISNEKAKTYIVYCKDRDLGHEIAYLSILSQVGQHLDAIGLHRVHALGIEAGGKAVLILLPMHGGKTTLALRLLGLEGIKLLSEDSPLISRSGEVFPFPLRIGVLVGEEPSGIPSKYLRTVQRMEFDPKTLIDIEYYKDKIGKQCPIGCILLGERLLSGSPFIRQDKRRSAINAFIKNAVIGLGLYQGMEFVFEKTAFEILGKTSLAFSRFHNSLKVIRQSQIRRFVMGPDINLNAEVLIKFIKEFKSYSKS